jgi:hypothetical protein
MIRYMQPAREVLTQIHGEGEMAWRLVWAKRNGEYAKALSRASVLFFLRESIKNWRRTRLFS